MKMYWRILINFILLGQAEKQGSSFHHQNHRHQRLELLRLIQLEQAQPLDKNTIKQPSRWEKIQLTEVQTYLTKCLDNLTDLKIISVTVCTKEVFF